MFLHKGKEYYPLEIRQIISKKESVIYDRDSRKKSYVYICQKTQFRYRKAL